MCLRAQSSVCAIVSCACVQRRQRFGVPVLMNRWNENKLQCAAVTLCACQPLKKTRVQCHECARAHAKSVCTQNTQQSRADDDDDYAPLEFATELAVVAGAPRVDVRATSLAGRDCCACVRT
jgi:hypothetical protein